MIADYTKSDYITTIIGFIIELVSLILSVVFCFRNRFDVAALMLIWYLVASVHDHYLLLKYEILGIKKIVDWKEDNMGGKDPEE